MCLVLLRCKKQGTAFTYFVILRLNILQLTCDFLPTQVVMYSRAQKETLTTAESKDFVIFYNHDGRELAECINQRFSDKRFACSVLIRDFTDKCKDLQNKNNPTQFQSGKVDVLIVSPAFLSYVKSSKNIPYDTIFKVPEKTVALYFYVPVEEAIKTMKDLCPNAERWTHKDTGTTTETLRECMVTLLTILEEDSIPTFPVLKKFSLVPHTITSTVDKVCVMFIQETRGKVEVVQGEDRFEAVFFNPYTYIFSPKCHYSGVCDLEVFVEGASVGKASLQYIPPIKELEICLSAADNPMDVLCTAVAGEGSSVGVLDQTLVHMFCNSSSLSGHFDLSLGLSEARHQELPTLLHLAAKFGLKNLCKSVVETSGGQMALAIKNSEGLIPAEIARKHEHQALANSLIVSSSVPEEKEDGTASSESSGNKNDEKTRTQEMSEVDIGNVYAFIEDRSSQESIIQRSVSSPAQVDQYNAIYMDMESITGSNRPDNEENLEVSKRK